MRVLGHIIVFCLALAAIQAILSLLVGALVVLLFWGLLFRTRLTVGLVALGLALGLATNHPVVFVALCGMLLVIKLMASRRER